MLDTFKDYAIDVSYKAVIFDSFMMISACLIASFLVNKTIYSVICILIARLNAEAST